MLFFVKTNKNKIYIQDWPETKLGKKNFTPLTEEQIAFYESNPDASVFEVQNCKLYEPYIPEEPELIEVQTQAIDFIKQYSLNTMDRFVSAYQLANAQCSILWAEKGNKGEVPIYDEETAQNYINTYLRIGGLCRAKFYEVRELIESVTNKSEIEEIKASAISYYDTLE